ncbi:MAG: SDR family oxidoreductase [Opitutaceae bacterium]|nr:SDR family oxidoreductase [Opitutaceae bacterium]
MNTNPQTETVLITGASSGIGLELARQFAAHGHTLILTAPVQAEIDAAADELEQRHGVPVHAFAADLCDSEALENLYERVEAMGLRVDILVNNAGEGQWGDFIEIPLERDLKMIRLNLEAVVRLTKRFLPRMIERGYGRILNTASIAGFEPGPKLAVYHATKAFVLSLSEALATEVANKGVTVTALCPGPVDTDFFPKADMVETRAFQEANVMSPEEVAEIGYAATMRGERVVVPGGMNKAMVFSRRMTSESLQAKKNEKLYSEVPPDKIKREPDDIAKGAGHLEEFPATTLREPPAEPRGDLR